MQDFDNYYKFMVDPNIGKYKLYKLVGNRETVLVDWASAEAIKHGTATNKLQVVAKGPTISILVNGTPLKSVEDAAFNQGKVGMMINAWYEPISARFDNLVVKPPE